MSLIGQFTRDDGGFIGHLETLLLHQDIIIIPAEPSDAENAPDFRVHIFDGMNNEPRAELGAGWKRTRREGRRVRRAAARRSMLFRSRSAPTCSSWPTTNPPGACTGTARPSAASGEERCRPARHRAAAGRFTPVRHAALLLLAGPASHDAGRRLRPARRMRRPSRQAPADPYASHIGEAARRFGIPEAWIRAVMRVESAGDVRAISSAGAMGLMQIMPATWTRAAHPTRPWQ